MRADRSYRVMNSITLLRYRFSQANRTRVKADLYQVDLWSATCAVHLVAIALQRYSASLL